MLAAGNSRGSTERGCRGKRKRGVDGKMATVPGWAQTPEVAGGARSMAASWLQAGWLSASGVALAQDALLAGAGKRPWEGSGNRPPAHPPGCVKGLGTCVPPTT